MTTQKTTIRKILILFTIAGTTIFLPPKVKAQAEIAEGASAIKGLYTAAKLVHDNWDIIKSVFRGMPHTW